MRIICPNCDYAQDIPEAKIPPRSVMATCPKCSEKFKFRELDPALLEDIQTDPGPETAAPARPGAEPPPPGPVMADDGPPAAPPMDTTPARSAPSPSAPPLVAHTGPGQEAPPQEPPAGDIWQRLEGLAGDEDRRADQNEGDDERREVPPPWERLDEYGFFPGLTATIKLVMFRSRDLFSVMPVAGGMAKPLIFYLLISEFAAVCQFIWQMLGMDLLMGLMDQGVTPEQTMLTGAGLLAYLVVYPLLLAGGLFVSAGLAHLMLMMVRAANGGFEGTFRVVAYSAAPIVLAVFPFVGSLIGALWSLFILLVGLRWVHRASYMRILVGLHIPVFVLIVLALATLLVAWMSGGL